MAGSVNKVILIGNLGRDPEVRSFPSGGRVANFSIATSENWRDKQSGERRERTEWHRIAVYNDGLVGVVERYLRKGSKVYVEGQLETRKWTDAQGQERYTTEIALRPFRSELTMLDGRGEGGGGGGQGGDDPYRGPSGGGGQGGGGDFGGGQGGGGSQGGGGQGGGGQSGPSSSYSGGSDDLDDEIPF